VGQAQLLKNTTSGFSAGSIGNAKCKAQSEKLWNRLLLRDPPSHEASIFVKATTDKTEDRGYEVQVAGIFE
jgi:hypothetical protein